MGVVDTAFESILSEFYESAVFFYILTTLDKFLTQKRKGQIWENFLIFQPSGRFSLENGSKVVKMFENSKIQKIQTKCFQMPYRPPP